MVLTRSADVQYFGVANLLFRIWQHRNSAVNTTDGNSCVHTRRNGFAVKSISSSHRGRRRGMAVIALMSKSVRTDAHWRLRMRVHDHANITRARIGIDSAKPLLPNNTLTVDHHETVQTVHIGSRGLQIGFGFSQFFSVFAVRGQICGRYGRFVRRPTPKSYVIRQRRRRCTEVDGVVYLITFSSRTIRGVISRLNGIRLVNHAFLLFVVTHFHIAGNREARNGCPTMP